MKKIIFYDSTCSLCAQLLQWILKKDKKKQFYFASLNSITAKQELKCFPYPDETILLLESSSGKKTALSHRSKAVFKIFWLLGGIWRFIGWKYILPSFLFDWCYRIIATNRRLLCKNKCLAISKEHESRFLP